MNVGPIWKVYWVVSKLKEYNTYNLLEKQIPFFQHKINCVVPLLQFEKFIAYTTGWYVRRGADKSLARPGRKQSTAIKLEIYSPHSPQSSIQFLTRCSNFFKLLKKFRTLSVKPDFCGSNDLRVGRKMATFQLFFSRIGLRTYQNPCICL